VHRLRLDDDRFNRELAVGLIEDHERATEVRGGLSVRF
jgi:hypothetical protein